MSAGLSAEAVARLIADLTTHDSGGLAYAAADCESVALVRADDLRVLLNDYEALAAEVRRLERLTTLQRADIATLEGRLATSSTSYRS